MPARSRAIPPADLAMASTLQAEEVLQAGVDVLQPLLELLLAKGVNFTSLVAALKPMCIEQACLELERTGRKPTDSAISLLSGVHRKDVRAWRERGRQRPLQHVPLTAQVIARWTQDPGYRGHSPLALPRHGDTPSFEALVRSLTADIHPYTMLAELQRLGQIRVETRQGQDWVVLLQESFLPPAGTREQLELLASNLSDHVRVAVANVNGVAPQLEQAVFAKGLREESVETLHTLARKLWAQMQAAMVAEASRLYDQDRGNRQSVHRMRVGVYFASDSSAEAPSHPEESA